MTSAWVLQPSLTDRCPQCPVSRLVGQSDALRQIHNRCCLEQTSDHRGVYTFDGRSDRDDFDDLAICLDLARHDPVISGGKLDVGKSSQDDRFGNANNFAVREDNSIAVIRVRENGRFREGLESLDRVYCDGLSIRTAPLHPHGSGQADEQTIRGFAFPEQNRSFPDGELYQPI